MELGRRFEFDPQRLAIEIAVEIDQMRFEQGCLGVLFEGRAEADAPIVLAQAANQGNVDLNRKQNKFDANAGTVTGMTTRNLGAPFMIATLVALVSPSPPISAI